MLRPCLCSAQGFKCTACRPVPPPDPDPDPTSFSFVPSCAVRSTPRCAAALHLEYADEDVSFLPRTPRSAARMTLPSAAAVCTRLKQVGV